MKVNLRKIRVREHRELARALRAKRYKMEVEAPVGRRRVDIRLPCRKVRIEVQGWAHGSDKQMHSDYVKLCDARSKGEALIEWFPSYRVAEDRKAIAYIVGLVAQGVQGVVPVMSANFRRC